MIVIDHLLNDEKTPHAGPNLPEKHLDSALVRHLLIEEIHHDAVKNLRFFGV